MRFNDSFSGVRLVAWLRERGLQSRRFRIIVVSVALVISGGTLLTSQISATAQTSAPPGDREPSPSFKVLKGVSISPTEAASYYGGATTSTDGLCRDYSANAQICPGGVRPRAPELKELSRALRGDPNLIYEYVRNGVDTEFMFGTHKGALGASIDKSAGVVDQAVLMVELLRESGHTASFVYGDITLNKDQFYSWTGIAKAKAACEHLAAGGVPATVNGVSGSCALTGDVTQIVMSHVWVQAVVGGQTVQFDPAFKPHVHRAGIDVRTAMGFSSGQALTAAKSGASSSATVASNFNASGLAGVLTGYATSLRSRLNQADLQGADLSDVVGGSDIEPLGVRPVGGWGVAALPYATTVRATWTNVPDQFRATLAVGLSFPATQSYAATSVSRTFFADEIYGRRLELSPRWDAGSGPTIEFDGVTLAHGGLSVILDRLATAQLGVNHPFAAQGGVYGDVSTNRPLEVVQTVSVLHSWGAASSTLVSKWSDEQGQDREGWMPVTSVETISFGDRFRSLIGANWQYQYAAAAKLHAQLANAKVQSLHAVGLVYAVVAPTPEDATYGGYSNVIDIESAVALTSLQDDAAARQAALHAIAATAATLEGSVLEQLSDSPDSASSARRFAWSNNATTDTRTPGGRSFYGIAAGTAAPVASNLVVDGRISGDTIIVDSSLVMSNAHVQNFKSKLIGAINSYSSNGFEITTSSDAGAGPGAQYGAASPYAYQWRAPSTQRGGAFVANKYVNGEISEIAHVLTNYYVQSKGGGGSMEGRSNEDVQKMLRDTFTDRSVMLGVDLKSGRAGYTSAPLRSIGQGEFPYKLEETLGLRGGVQPIVYYGAVGPQPRPDLNRITGGLVSNFDGSAALSNSGGDALGASRPEGTVKTIVAFVAMQDIWKSAAAPAREISGLLAADWWGRQILSNVLTLNQGAGAERYVKDVNGTDYLPVSGGPAKATVTGSRTAYRPTRSDPEHFYVDYRLFDDSGLQISAQDGSGGQRSYQYWSRLTALDDGFGGIFPHRFSGFRLKTWSFASGVSLTVNYNPYTTPEPLQATPVAIPISVTSNLGPTLALSTVPKAIFWRTTPRCISWTAQNTGTPPANQNLEEFTDVAGRTTRLRFRLPVVRTVNQRPDDACRIEAVHTPKDLVTPSITYAYDTTGRIKEARDGVAIREPGVRGAHQFFIAEGYRGERQDPTGGRYAVETLAGGRLTRHIDEMGRVTSSEFDGRGRVKARVLPWLERQEFTYDDRDNVIEKRRISNGTPETWWRQTIVLKAQYHATWNKPVKVILPPTLDDPVEREYDYSYNAQGLVSQVQAPIVQNGTTGANARPTWDMTYDSYGRPLTTTDPTGRRVTNGYGQYSQPAFCLTSTTEASQAGGLNLLTKFTCNSVGDVLTVTDPRNNVTTTSYDTLRRKTETFGPAGTNIRTQWVYDLDGNPTEEKKWDAAAGLWRTTVSAFSATGKVLTVTDASGDVARVCYDAMDREKIKVDPQGRAIRTSYNAAGQPTVVDRWFRANVADATCALTAELPAGQTTHAWRSYSYLANGLVAGESDARGNETSFGYDGLGRKTQTVYPDPDGSGPQVPPWEYTLHDQRDQLAYVKHRSHSGDVKFTKTFFDAAGRTTYLYEFADSETWPKGRVTRTNYDLAGRRVYSDVSDQPTAGSFSNAAVRDKRTYAYDAAGRVTQDHVAPEYGTNPSLTFEYVYGYDAAGNRTSIQWPGGWTATYTFDAANRMATVSFTGGSGTWAYDSQSRPTSFTRSNGTSTTYAYEPDSDLGEVTQTFTSGSPASVPFAYDRDKAGLILYRSNPSAYDWAPTLGLARTYGAANALNQVASEAGVPLTFDGRGNMTSDGISSFTYDMRNRLRTATRSGMTASYDYDGDDRRTKKTVNGVVTRMLWSGQDELAEADAAGTILRRFVPGAAVDTPLASVAAAGTVTWIHADGQGSIINTSNSAGAAGTPTTYSSYGELGGAPQPGVPFGYTGRYHDAETGLWYYRARYYNPRLGQFLQVDPIGTKDDPNLYTYVAGDPVNLTDPTGEFIPALVGCAVNVVCRTGVGAGVGAVIGGGAYMLEKGISGEQITVSGLLIAGAGGAADGAMVANGVNPMVSGGLAGGAAAAGTAIVEGKKAPEVIARSGVGAAASALGGRYGGRIGATIGDNVVSAVVRRPGDSLALGAGAGELASQVAGGAAGSALTGVFTANTEGPSVQGANAYTDKVQTNAETLKIDLSQRMCRVKDMCSW